jgi:dTDP-4-dehydrorhamnose reductase
MTLSILQFGTTGQLATELIRQAPRHDVNLTALSRQDCDFADPELAARIVFERRPDLVVIAAAYTAVDLAETERELSYEINAETPAAIAGVCGPHRAMVNFSTDYVFDGEKGAPYVEEDTPNPLNAYGEMKLSGERMVLAACPRSVVIRTSWVVSAHGKNFVKTVLRLAGEGKPLKVVDDQQGRPTAAADLAGFVLSQAVRIASAPVGDPALGLLHFANAGEVTWRGFAQAILEEAYGADAPEVAPTTTAEFGAPARRPLRATMDTSKVERVYGVTPRPWREALKEIVAELKG